MSPMKCDTVLIVRVVESEAGQLFHEPRKVTNLALAPVGRRLLHLLQKPELAQPLH